MATGAAKWIWENSRASNGSLIVLLAIADECGEGEFTDMKIADLAVKCRLSDKGARNAVKDLVALGELSVEGGRGAVGRYVVGPTSVKTTDVHRQNLPTSRPTSVETTELPRRQNLPTSPEEPHVNGSSVKTTGVEIPDVLKTTTGTSEVGVKEESAKRRKAPAAPRPDVDRLCEHLASRIEANGSNRPAINRRWKDAARLLLDKDGRTEEQVHACIDWCQQDTFWLRQIMSMEKLREKYDRLRLDAIAAQQRKAPAAKSTTNDRVQAAIDAGKRLQAMMEGRS